MSNFFLLWACIPSILFVFQKMNTRRTIGQSRGGAGGNKVPPRLLLKECLRRLTLLGSLILRWGNLWPRWHMQSLCMPMPWLTRSTSRMFWRRTHRFLVWMKGWETLWGWILIFLRLRRIFKSFSMRCVRSWWLWVPQIITKQIWLPINSRMFHKRGARFGKIAEFWVEFGHLGSI